MITDLKDSTARYAEKGELNHSYCIHKNENGSCKLGFHSSISNGIKCLTNYCVPQDVHCGDCKIKE